MEHHLLHEGVHCVIKVARDMSGMQWLQSLLTPKEGDGRQVVTCVNHASRHCTKGTKGTPDFVCDIPAVDALRRGGAGVATSGSFAYDS